MANHLTFRASDDPVGSDPLTIARANRAYDARHGFSPKECGLGFTRLEYPPYVPAVPGYQYGVTTDEDIHAWDAAWLEQRIAGLGLAAPAFL